MPEENMPLDRLEQLRSENEFLKMKLMLERGASFNTDNGENDIPPEIENKFLSNIIDFESQFDKGKKITVFEKIGRPSQFRPLKEIPAGQYEKAWQELSSYLESHSISVDACSPNVTAAELYRFTTEELFPHETDDINIAGMLTCFIYDEFHPDHAYDNSRLAINDCIRAILSKEPLEWTHYFCEENIRLNERIELTVQDFKTIINQFKSVYDSIEIRKLEKVDCTVDKTKSLVKGDLSVTLIYGNQKEELTGVWEVEFEWQPIYDNWRISSVRIPGINF